MGQSGGLTGGIASAGAEADFGGNRSGLRLNAAVRDTLRRLFPTKTADNASALTGLTKRRCEQLLSEQTGISAPVLADLIKSEVGFEFLEAVMGDDAPGWFNDFRYQVEAARLDAELAELRERQRNSRKGMRRAKARRT